MFRNLLKKLLSWLRELWSLFKAIDGAVSKESKDTIKASHNQSQPQSKPAIINQPQSKPAIINQHNQSQPLLINTIKASHY
ncbi:hypothetical protein [Shewanella sp.]|uniref:hypothetical protein n=1 Tax=Shewanella sp. TaxID=50422 RepID=UPI001EB57A46|nr:hypothetical protein [Shewanella sp.]NRB24453.1 hypothetical protein [Shewanella sp.]